MPNIAFTNNYSDLSSNRGFQFRFHCQKCGNGYMSTFKANSLGVAASAASAVSSLLGGIFGRAVSGAQQLESLAAGPQHDAALSAAIEEIAPKFRQCTRCGRWVCEPICWNAKVGLCETCAPDVAEETAAVEATTARDRAGDKARGVGAAATPAASACGNCGAQTNGAKFCPECGTPTARKQTCQSCGAVADGSPKFCPECGKPFGKFSVSPLNPRP